MGLKTYTTTVATTGAAGSATGSATLYMQGIIRQVHLDFHADAASTTDTTISFAAPSVGNILVVTNSKTDAVYRPKLRAVDNSADTVGVNYGDFYVNGKVTVSLAQCDELPQAINVVFIVEEVA